MFSQSYGYHFDHAYFSFLFSLLDKTYINVNFKTNEELDHGKRYIVCIHAPRIVHRYEKWNETFPEISACSDGITVDMTPPRPGNAWIGLDSSERYQVIILQKGGKSHSDTESSKNKDNSSILLFLSY